MRLIKMFLFVLVGLFAVITIIGLFIPSSVKISRGVIINADSSLVYNNLKDVKNWSAWMPWVTTDSGAVVQLSQVTDQPGSFFRWKGVKINSSGTITIKAHEQDQLKLLYELQDMNKAEGGFRIRKTGTGNNVTEVLWFMEYKLKWYPWEKFSSLMLENSYGPSMERGLANLKKNLEE